MFLHSAQEVRVLFLIKYTYVSCLTQALVESLRDKDRVRYFGTLPEWVCKAKSALKKSKISSHAFFIFYNHPPFCLEDPRLLSNSKQ